MQRVWHLAHALDVASRGMLQTVGVTGPQRLVIRVIGQSPGLAAAELATTLGLHPSTLTGVLSRLEQQGLIVRARDLQDARRANIQLTTAGQRIDRDKRGTVEAAVRRALARADRATIERTQDMLGLLVDELERLARPQSPKRARR
jgi:DNA-binding MarR family transcriptional regulator